MVRRERLTIEGNFTTMRNCWLRLKRPAEKLKTVLQSRKCFVISRLQAGWEEGGVLCRGGCLLQKGLRDSNLQIILYLIGVARWNLLQLLFFRIQVKFVLDGHGDERTNKSKLILWRNCRCALNKRYEDETLQQDVYWASWAIENQSHESQSRTCFNRIPANLGFAVGPSTGWSVGSRRSSFGRLSGTVFYWRIAFRGQSTQEPLGRACEGSVLMLSRLNRSPWFGVLRTRGSQEGHD